MYELTDYATPTAGDLYKVLSLSHFSGKQINCNYLYMKFVGRISAKGLAG
jgi:hypothetical protein